MLCGVTTFGQHKTRRILNLDHHLYDNLCDRWVRQLSKPQPFICVSASVNPQDYNKLGFTLDTEPESRSIQGMANTGCQSCLAEIKTIHQLSLTDKDLIPVSMCMHAANNRDIKILGAAAITYTVESKSSLTLETCQITHVTDSTDKVFLSSEACVELGMISMTFPAI